MRLRILVILFCALSACTSSNGSRAASRESWPSNVRLAQAQISPDENKATPIQGTLNFEQMPNSVIITYRIEGLEPKGNYQILVQENLDCESVNVAQANSLRVLKANKEGIAENTFKTQEFSVSKDRALLGSSVVIARAPQGKRQSQSLSQLACAPIEPFNAQVRVD